MDRVIIGVDPHKLSVTIEARDTREILRATGRFGTDTRSYHQLLKVARQWPQRIWAVEGANGIGRPLAQRLLADRERVLDVPAKLAARARVFDTGQGRKTDAADAHAIVMVALRDKGLRELRIDPELTVLRMLCDRRDELSRARAQALNRLHRLFLGLLAGGAPVKKSARQYKALLATVRPRDLAGKTCRRMAAEELEDLERLDVKLKAMKAELKAAVQATGSHLMDIHGIGPAGAARILADVGDITRFPDRSHFASWNGTAPIDASSGQHTRHRLSRAGNRRINHVLYMAGIVQLRNDTTGRAYYRRKLQQSKTSMEAMRCLRRRLSDTVYRKLVTDAAARQAALHQTGPGGHSGAAPSSSAAGLPPGTGTSDQPLPGPAHQTLPPPQPALKTPAAPIAATSRRRARGVNVERPTGRTTLTPTSVGARSTAPGPRT
jgi:transposase